MTYNTKKTGKEKIIRIRIKMQNHKHLNDMNAVFLPIKSLFVNQLYEFEIPPKEK